jgi:hypothetical protein
MPAATTIHRRSQRAQRDPNRDNALTWARHRFDDVDTYPVILADLLEAGETFFSVTSKDRVGVTVSLLTITAAGLLEVTVTKGSGSLLAQLLTTRGPETLAETYTVLNDLKAKYEAHRVDLDHHDLANSTDAVTSPDATTFPTAVTLADELKVDFTNHRTDTNEDSHPVDDDSSVITAASAPATLADLITLTKDILAQYLAHIRDTSHAWHNSAPDTTSAPAALGSRTISVPLQWRPTWTTGPVPSDRYRYR